MKGWIARGNQYRILHHEPPLIGKITRTSYAFSVQKRNPRIAWFFWGRISYADDFAMAERVIAKEREINASHGKRTPRRTRVVTADPRVAPIEVAPSTSSAREERKKSHEWEFRIVALDPPHVSSLGTKYPLRAQGRIVGGTDWSSFGNCETMEEAESELQKIKNQIQRSETTTEKVVRYV